MVMDLKKAKKGEMVEKSELHKNGLTAKQTLFVKYYLLHKVASKAAKAAGYSPANAGIIGSSLLRNKRVHDAIHSELEKEVKAVEAEYAIDKTFVLTKTVEVFEACIRDNDKPNALKALEIIGKHIDINAFNREKEQSITNHIVNNILPAADFRKFITDTGILTGDFINNDNRALNIGNSIIEDTDILIEE